MSPDAVWQYGCTSKSADPVLIQAPHHRATFSHEREEGPFQAVLTARCLGKASNDDSVGYYRLPSRSLISQLSPNIGYHRWCRGKRGFSFRFYPLFCSPRHISAHKFGTMTQLDAAKKGCRFLSLLFLEFLLGRSTLGAIWEASQTTLYWPCLHVVDLLRPGQS